MAGNALINYLRESKEELKKVTWPSREKVIRDTFVVIGLAVGVALFFGVVDYGLTTLLQKSLAL